MLPFPCLLSPSYFCTWSSHCPSVHFGFLFFLQTPSLLRSLPRPTFLPSPFPQTAQWSCFSAVLGLCSNDRVSRWCSPADWGEPRAGEAPLLRDPAVSIDRHWQGLWGTCPTRAPPDASSSGEGDARYETISDWDRNLLVYGASTQRNLSLECSQRSKRSPHFRPGSLVPPVGEIVLLMGTFPAPKELGNKHAYMF